MRFSRSDQRRYVSAGDVLRGETPRDAITDKLVLVGVTALGLTDAPPTPVSARMHGVEIQAQLLENLLYGHQLRRPDFARWVEALAGVVAGAALIACLPMLSGFAGLVLLLVVVALLAAGSALGVLGLGLLFDALLAIAYVFVTYLVLSACLLWTSERSRRALRVALEGERVRLARIDGELGAARDIQRGILPDTRRFDLPAGSTLHAFLEPAAEVGGDLYDIAWLDERRLFIILGDVSGKGVPASLFMAVSKTLCKSTASRAAMGIDAILTQANREIGRENPTLLFVTALAVILDVMTGDIEFASAGHEPPLVACSGQAPRRLLNAGGPPLCALEDFAYPRAFDRLAPGETLILVTDGVTEAMNPEGGLYGTERIMHALAQTAPQADAEAVITELRADLAAFTRGAEPNDDIAILAFQMGESRVPDGESEPVCTTEP